MKEKVKKYWWVIVVILVIGGVFYWFQLRPSIIYSLCHNQAVEKAQKLYKDKIESQYYVSDEEKERIKNGWYFKDDYESYYKQCLRIRGINK